MRWIVNFNNEKSPCRVNQAASSVGKFIYSFGGYCQKTTVNDLKFYSPIDVYVLNTINFKWTKRPRPQLRDPQYLLTPYFRYCHTCVTYNDKIYLWGGRADWTNSLCNVLFSYNPKTHLWKKILTEGLKPDGRDGHTAVVIDNQNTMLIFGGYVQKVEKFSNDIYEYNFKTSVWTLIIPKNTIRPHWRDFHTASVIDGKMYIFGGRMDMGHQYFTGESFYSNDLYMFDPQKKVWTELKPDSTNHILPIDSDDPKLFSPSGRRSHSAVVYKRKIIIFGGFQENKHKHFNDMYELNVDKCEWKVCSLNGIVPSARRRHSCCVIDDRMFLFCGTGPTNPASIPNNNTENTFLANEPNLLTTTNVNNQEIQNIYELEPFLQQLETNMNQINMALRMDTNNFNMNILNHVVGLAISTLARPVPENEQNIDEPNQDETIDLTDQIRLNTARLQNLIIPEPQEEFQDMGLEEYHDANDQMETGEVNTDNNLEIIPNPENVDNYIDEELNDDVLDDEDDNTDHALMDTDDETSDEDEDSNLISLSDLHILDFEISSLRYLSMIQIIEDKIDYKILPINLIHEIDSLTSIDKLD